LQEYDEIKDNYMESKGLKANQLSQKDFEALKVQYKWKKEE